jgi:hypothetical protein
MSAVGVEDMQAAIRCLEHHQRGTECVHLVRLAVSERLAHAEAVPSASESIRGRTPVDHSNVAR